MKPPDDQPETRWRLTPEEKEQVLAGAKRDIEALAGLTPQPPGDTAPPDAIRTASAAPQ